jgi:opacity protein-like surface antigen
VKHFVLGSFVAAAAIVVASNPVQAQAYNPFQIGAAAGVAIPTGDFGNQADLGYNVTFAVGYKPQFTPIGVRLEAAYNQMGISGGGGNFNIPAFTGNLIFGLPIAMASPYVIGGAGLYRTNVDIQGLGSGGDNHFGFNIGGGVKIPLTSSFETFVEARYNRVTLDQGNISFVPITVGIMF